MVATSRVTHVDGGLQELSRSPPWTKVAQNNRFVHLGFTSCLFILRSSSLDALSMPNMVVGGHVRGNRTQWRLSELLSTAVVA